MAAKLTKKTFNVDGDLAQTLDDFMGKNPHLSFTLVVNEALRHWLRNPEVKISRVVPATERDVEAFLRENEGLMNDLGA